jgi:hypothetical protein
MIKTGDIFILEFSIFVPYKILNKNLNIVKKIDDIVMNIDLGKNLKSKPPFLHNIFTQFLKEIPKRGC